MSPIRRRALLPSVAALVLAAPAAIDAGPEPARFLTKPFTPTAPAVYTTRVHNVGLLTMKVASYSTFGDPLHAGINAEWRGTECLYVAGLWVGAVGADGGMHVSTADNYEFRNGIGPSDTIYESFEGEKGGKRAGLVGSASYGDDDGDGLVDEDFQNGRDDDGDGKIDEDFAAIGQQMFSVTYRDDTPEAIAQLHSHYPLGLLVRQRSFAWSVPDINEMIGVDWQIVNDGDQVLTDLYLAFLVDPDIGPPDNPQYYTDDLAGPLRIMGSLVHPQNVGPCPAFDFDLPAMVAWDAPDIPSGTDGGDSPAHFGNILLDHTTDVEGIRAPRRVDALTSQWFRSIDGASFTDTTRYDMLAGGTVSGITPDAADYRYVMSVGPFASLSPGESLTLDGAFVVGEGLAGFQTNALSAARVYLGSYRDLDGDPTTGIDGKETCLRLLEPGGTIVWTDPCDTLAAPVEWSSTDCLWVDEDCNPCTGVNGAETRIDWTATVAPPFPGTNMDPSLFQTGSPLPPLVPPAQDGRAVIQWDNLPERWIDPGTGLETFAGYRLYKAGPMYPPTALPGHDQWTLFATYRTNPGPGDTDLSAITNTSLSPIGTDENGAPIYPIGRYEVPDSNVVNGFVYYYSVVPFGERHTVDPQTMEVVVITIVGLPVASPEQAVVPCEGCGVVPVRLLAFSVTRTENGVLLTWKVASADDAAGFHVYREDPGADRVQLTDRLLAGRTEYTYTDPGSPPVGVRYWLQALDRAGDASWLGPYSPDIEIVLPPALQVGRATPNPASAATRIQFVLPGTRTVRASVYDLAGRRVRTLLDAEQGPGGHVLLWTGETDAGVRATPGLYVIALQAGSERASRKVMLLR